jgi:gamma-glutamylputrescine oxidase
VVGGGVTGCACALSLAEQGLRVRLHEAREVASGASGRNGGFALRGGAMPYDVARRELGRDAAAELWALTERALARMQELAGDAFRPTGSLRLAADDAERAELEAEHAALREDGFAAEWRETAGAPLARFRGAIFHPPDGSLHPARWVRRLADRAAAAGVEVREGSPVSALGDLEADRVVIATDGYTRGLVAELDAAIRPTRGQVLATEPLGGRPFPLPHYARGGYDYWQQLPDGRLVAGGRRDTTLEREWTAEEATTPEIQSQLERLVEDLLGELPRITHRWAGIFGTTSDLLPLVGELPSRPGVWVAAGYSGHGNVLGLACGELVAAAIAGRRDSVLDLVEPARLLELEPQDV